MKSTFARIMAIFLAVVWLFVIALNYYIVHKPFSIENVSAIWDTFANLLVVGLLFLLAAILGNRITRSVSFATPLESLTMQTGLGLAVISFATFGLGLLGWLNPILFWVLLLIGFFLLRYDVRAVIKNLRATQFPADSSFERWLVIFVLLSLFIALFYALTPPIAWDSQTYHLLIPRTALDQGRIAPPPNVPYFSFPSLIEMLFLAAMVLKGDIAAQAIHLGFFVLLSGAVFSFAQKYSNPRVAWLSVAVLIATPSLLLISTWAYVDLALAFYAFAVFYAMRIALESDKQSWLMLAGVFAGLAMGVKYTAVIIPVALSLILLLRHRSRIKQGISRLIVFASVAGVVAAPWYLRNWIFMGNPFYPFVFGGPDWDSFRAEWFSRFGTGLGIGQLLIAPWDATIYGVEGALGYEATIGPLLLMLVPMLLVGFIRFSSQPDQKEPSWLVRDAFIFALVLYVFWLIGLGESKLLLQTRLLFPEFPAFAFLAAVAFDRLSQIDLPQFSLQRFTRMVIVLVLGLTMLNYVLAFLQENPMRYLAGYETRSAFLSRNLGDYITAVRFLNMLPSNARVLYLWEPRAYYARVTSQPDSLLDQFEHLRWQVESTDAIAERLRKEGYTHVLLNRIGLDGMLQSGYDPISDQDMQILGDLLARQFNQVYGKTPFRVIQHGGRPGLLDADKDAYAVYELVPREAVR